MFTLRNTRGWYRSLLYILIRRGLLFFSIHVFCIRYVRLWLAKSGPFMSNVLATNYVVNKKNDVD